MLPAPATRTVDPFAATARIAKPLNGPVWPTHVSPASVLLYKPVESVAVAYSVEPLARSRVRFVNPVPARTPAFAHVPFAEVALTSGEIGPSTLFSIAVITK